MTKQLRFWMPASVLVGVLGACSSGARQSGSGGQGGPGGNPADGGPDGNTADGGCAQFIACTYAAAPDQAAGASSAYGPGGSCWTTQSADICTQGCATGLQGLHQAYPSVAACALCKSDADCSGSTPACDTVHGECVACTSDASCQAPNPRCDLASHTCAPPLCVPAQCHNVGCGTIPDGCGGTVDCGSCDDGNACTTDTCDAGHCTHAPQPDLSGCGAWALCLNGSCAPLHADCIASNPNAKSFFTYNVNPDPQNMSGWDVGDQCICNGTTLETLFNGSLGPTISEPCSQCVQASTYGNRYCFQ